MINCSDFSNWDRHAASSSHEPLDAETVMSDSSVSDSDGNYGAYGYTESQSAGQNVMSADSYSQEQFSPSVHPHSPSQEQDSGSLSSHTSDHISSPEPDDADGSSSDDEDPLDPGGDWHPFKSRVHCQLVLLCHGSHRRNTDLVSLRAYMHVLKVRVWHTKYSLSS